jgi:cysteine desulfurase
MYFFDHQNTSPPLPEALEALSHVESSFWGNRAVPYPLSSDLFAIEKETYELLYQFVDAQKEDHFIFTSSGTEAVNHAILGTFLDVTQQEGKHHYLATSVGEAPTIMGMTRLEERGCQFEMLSLENGELTVEKVAEKLTPATAMLSMPGACGITGVIHPIQEIATLCRERGVLLHVEGTHLLGRIPFSFQESGCDFFSFHGEQLGAPRGCGGLFIRKGAPVGPLLVGGNEQGKWRGGNFCLGLLAALGVCVKKAQEELLHRSMESGRLRALFEEKLQEKYTFIQIALEEKLRLPHITTLLFDKVTSDALLWALSQKQIFATMGGGYFQQIAYLLQAYGFEERLSRTGLSFSISHTMEEEHLLKAIDLIGQCLEERMRISHKLVEEAAL